MPYTLLLTRLQKICTTGTHPGITLWQRPLQASCCSAFENAAHGSGPGRTPSALCSVPSLCARAGATATLVNDACMTPWDVVKQRMQVSHSPYRSLSHCITETWRQQGLSAFYRSYWTTVSETKPWHGCVWKAPC